MPEGFKSIADLQVTIDANTEKLSGGLTLAHNLVQRFAGEGTQALTKFDSAVAVTSAGIKTMLGPIGTLITAVETVTKLWDKYGAKVGEVAEKLGIKEEFDDIQKSATGLTASVQDALPVAYDKAKQAALQYITGSKEGAETVKQMVEASNATLTTATPQAFAAASAAAKTHADIVKTVAVESEAAVGQWNTTLKTEVPKSYQAAAAAAQQAQSTVTAAAKDQAAAIKESASEAGQWITTVNAEQERSFGNTYSAMVDAYGKGKELSAEQASELIADTKKVDTAWQNVAKQVRDTFDIMNAVVTSFYKDDKSKTTRELENDLKRAEAQISSLDAAIVASTKNAEFWSEALGGKATANTVKQIEALGTAMLTVQELMVRINEAKRDKALGDWGVTVNSAMEDQINKETEALKKRFAAIGLSAPDLAAYNERERLTAMLTKDGRDALDGETAAMERKIATTRNLKLAEADYAQDKKQDEDAERQDQQVGRIMINLETELRAIQRRTTALSMSTVEAARSATVEKGLAEIRRIGRDATDDERVAIEAHAAAVGEATQVYLDGKMKLEQLQATAGIVTRSMESAFQKFTSGAKVDWSEMVRSMIADLALLTFKQGVTQPLAQLLTGGGAAGGSGLLGQLFGGFKAEGGAVDPSQAYIVGERGPELFMPSAAGNIVPNHALGGGATTVNLTTTIDARGAYPESIADIRKSVSDLHQALPGRVLEVVREAKDRGL